MATKQSSLVSADYKMKMRIFKSLCACMEETRFEKVTVKSLCDAAGISRASFYHHFTDKYEVATWYAGLLAQHGVYETGRSLSWHDGMVKTLRGMRAVDPFFQTMGKLYGDDFLTDGSVDRREENLAETVTVFKETKIDRALKLQIRALALVETHLTNEWLMKNDAQSAEEFVDALAPATPSVLQKLLATPSPKATMRPFFNLLPIEN